MTTSDVVKCALKNCGESAVFELRWRTIFAELQAAYCTACASERQGWHAAGRWRRIGETEWRTGPVEEVRMVVHCARVANTTVCGLPVGVSAVTLEERFTAERAKREGLTRCPACIAAVAGVPPAPPVHPDCDCFVRRHPHSLVHNEQCASRLEPPKAAAPEPSGVLSFVRWETEHRPPTAAADDIIAMRDGLRRTQHARLERGPSAVATVRDLSPHLHSHVIRQPVGPQPCDNDEDGTL